MRIHAALLLLTVLSLSGQMHYAHKAWIDVPTAPRCMAYDRTGERLIVAGGGQGEGYLSAVPSSDRIVTPFGGRTPSLAVDINVSPKGIYITERHAGTLIGLSTDGTPRQTRYLGYYPGPTLLLPDSSAALVLCGTDWHPGGHDSGSALRMVSLPLSDAGDVRVCELPEARYGEVRSLCLSRDGRRVYVAAAPSDYGAATLISIELPSLRILAQRTVTADGAWVSRSALAISADNEPVMAVDAREGSFLAVFSPDLEPVRRIPLGMGPTYVAAAPGGNHAVLASRGDSCLRSLDLQSLALGEPFESPAPCPRLLCFDHVGRQLFVSSSYASRIAVLERTSTHPERSPPRPSPSLEERIVYSIHEDDRTVILATKPDGSDPRVILDLPEAVGGAMSISPDGTRLSYHRNVDHVADIFVLNILTRETTRLTHLMRDEGLACRGAACSYWLPHGRALVYEAGYSMYETKLFLVSAEGGTPRILVDAFEERDMVPVPHPWDPDRMLFLFDKGNWTFNRQLRLFDRDTGSQWIILPDDGHADDSPAWHPEGDRIFWTQSGTTLQSPATVWTAKADGNQRTQVMPYPKGLSTTKRVAAISPDHTRILYTQAGPQDEDVYIWDPGKSEAIPVATSDVREQAVDWCLMALPP